MKLWIETKLDGTNSYTEAASTYSFAVTKDEIEENRIRKSTQKKYMSMKIFVIFY